MEIHMEILWKSASDSEAVAFVAPASQATRSEFQARGPHGDFWIVKSRNDEKWNEMDSKVTIVTMLTIMTQTALHWGTSK